MLSGGMFGNLVNKNARAALKEYGDQNGLGIEYEMLNDTGSPHSPQYSARVRVGESSFDAPPAATKKDAKEFAADLALRALSQEPGSQFGMYPASPGMLAASGLSPEAPFPQHKAPGYRPKYHRQRQPRPKNNQLSAPPDKDPVMLINEYGQKMNLTVKFEDTPCVFPGMYESQVTVGTQAFGPKRSAKKKLARKLAAVVGLKELINWEPKEGLYDLNEGPTQPPAAASGMDGSSGSGQGVVLEKDPVMLLNEYCQRSQLTISYEEMSHTEPDRKKSFSCTATVGDRVFESGKGATKNKAKKDAALTALKSLFDMPIEMSTAAKEAKKAIERHPVSILNEHGQKHNQKVEFQDLGYTGPDHNRTYSFSVTVGDRTFDTGHGRSKKEAKKECAKIALGVLLGMPVEPGSVLPSEPAGDDSSSTPRQPGVKSRVSALYEFCQSYKLTQPESVEAGPDARINTGMHYLAFKVGDETFSPGEGRTKKAAREVAANLALEELEKMHVGSKYSPVGSTEGDQLAALSWNCLSFVSIHAPESWRFAGYKVLAAVIMQDSTNEAGTVISIGTGNKCIGGDQLRLDGSMVCDSHAEVVARRGLIRFLMTQLDLLFKKSDSDATSIFLPKTKGAKVKLREDVKFSLYISTAPCGDASVFVNESGAEGADKSPLMFGSKQHGLLRSKVEKGEGTIPLDSDDSIQTIDGIRRGQRLRTASCSDKIAKWNVLGVQGALLSNIIEPIYLSSVIVGNLYDQTHLTRALSARVEHQETKKSLSTRLPAVYHVNHPMVQCGRLAPLDSPRDVETKGKTNNMSLNWTLGDEKHVEVLDACLGRDETSRVPSRLSKMALYVNFVEVAKKSNEYKKVIEAKSYRKAKDLASDYLKAKNLFFSHLKDAGYGDWNQMKKPVELNQFA